MSEDKDDQCECWKHFHMTGGYHLTTCSRSESYVDPVAEIQQPLMQEKLNEFTKPEWKAGELPPVGTVCEISEIDDSMHSKLRAGDQVTIIAHYKNNSKTIAAFTFAIVGGLLVDSSSNGFRPIQTKKERVIAKAKSVAVTDGGMAVTFSALTIDLLYEAGCLINPDKGEE